MEELMALLESTKEEQKALKSLLNETKSNIVVVKPPEDPKKETKKKIDMIDVNNAKKVIQKNEPVISFSKSQRFKTPTQHNDSLLGASVQSNDSVSTVASASSLDHIKNKPANVVFPKAPRFVDSKTAVITEFNLNPNFEATKKKFPAAVIKESTPKDMKAKLIKKLGTTGVYAKAAAAPAEEHAKEVQEAAAEEMSFSDILSDSTVESLGPGAYNPNYDAVETKKGFALSKSGRFIDPKPVGNYQEINPNYQVIRKAAPGVKIAQNVPVSAQLRRKRQIEDELLDVRNRVRNQASLDRDAALRRNVPKVAIVPEYSGMNNRQRLARILRFLRERDAARRVAPGTYEPKEQDEPICLVAYRQSLSPKVVRLPERPPSPTRYYAKDDLIKQKPPAFFFSKEGIEVKVKYDDFDWKKPLDINLDLVKPRIPTALVLPEHNAAAELPELEDLKRGPGKYDPSYNLVERRPDIGVMKMPDINEHNARENLANLAKKDAVDVDLNINYDPILPHHPEWKIHSPVKLDGPAHIPDKFLHPERFRFYDVNLDAIKPDQPDITLASGLTREQYLDKEREMNQFLGMREYENKLPEAGHYNVKYNAIDKDLPTVDFAKFQERGLDEPIDKDQDIDGDVLILNPERPKPHMPNIQFDKLIGREEVKKDDEFREELLLEPKYDLIDPKTVVLVNMNKQMERKDPYEVKVDPTREELILDVNYGAIDPKPKNIPDFEKQIPRKEIEVNENQEEVILNPNYKVIQPEGPSITFPKAKRVDELQKENINDGKTTTEQQINMEKALQSIKAHSPAVDFKSYAKRDTVKEDDKKKQILQKQKEEQEKIKKNLELNQVEEEKGEAFEKYQSSPKIIKKDSMKKPPKPKDKKIEDKKEEKIEPKLIKSEISPWGEKGGTDLGNEADEDL